MTEKQRPTKEQVEMEEKTKDETVGEKLIELQQQSNEVKALALALLQEAIELLKEISLQISAVGVLADFIKTEKIAEGAPQEPKPKFTPQEYNSLPWHTFTTKKNQTWQKFSSKEDCGTRNPIRDNLVEVCTVPNEATISAPILVYDYGYWIFKDWLYRREIKSPRK